ncbi:transmembrane protein, putative (macronuclear) [Tetrahymena thermophila SB210]|nr:transmembrane protein, putative [Tetrahymena thermophila SB210]EAR81076.2 transmembrane protein, putative [Tetrahymena thermophila SB210]|eukprot:XP_001028739.2 transmembrane protein, putative [Tetrahymena thermophila SB210]
MVNHFVQFAKMKMLIHQRSVYSANNISFLINRLLDAKNVIYNVQNVKIKVIIVLVASFQIKLHQLAIAFSKKIKQIFANVIINAVLVVALTIIFALHALLKGEFYLTANAINSTKKFNKNVLKQKYCVLTNVQVASILVIIVLNARQIEQILHHANVFMAIKSQQMDLAKYASKVLFMILSQRFAKNAPLGASLAVISSAYCVCLDFKRKDFFVIVLINYTNKKINR